MNAFNDSELMALLASCRQHSDQAFNEILRRYTPMINSVIASFAPSVIDRDDMFSEACLALHIATLRYDVNQDKVTFGLYARVCVHNRLIDMHRRIESAPDVADTDVDTLSDGCELESEIVAKETVNILLHTAQDLLSDYEHAVLMLHIQGYKTSDIAAELSRSPKSVDNAKARIFRRLREAVSSDLKFK